MILLFLSHWVCTAQDRFTVRGYIKDETTGEDLIGATVLVENAPMSGTATNAYGFYSLTLNKGIYNLHFQYIGYNVRIIKIDLMSDTLLNIELAQRTYEINNITVAAKRADNNVSSLDIGEIKLHPKEIESIPAFFGERDILKTIQLTPGVKPAGEGNSGYYVRGGGAGQNLILLDEAPVYNPSHLLGFFSVFNSDAIKDASLMKGSIPARYGGRASSVMDIVMKDGNMKEFRTTGNIGLISSSLTMEGPIVKDTGSFIVSARRTYADLFLLLSHNQDLRKTHLYFYDLNAKANYNINKNNRIFLSGYFGRDDFGYSDQFGFDWGSATATLRWNHVFNDALFANTSLILSNYSYRINIMGDLNINIRSDIRDWNLKQDYAFYPNAGNTIRFGANIIYHNILPGKISGNDNNSIVTNFEITNRRAIESALYISDGQTISSRLKLYYGLRLALFSNVGPGDFYTFDENGGLLATRSYNSFRLVKTQGGLEPRVSVNYRLSATGSLKASYNRIHQFLHLLSNSTTSTPTDVWLPSSNNVRPQIADQVEAGYFRNFGNNRFETSLEVYYKNLQNQIDYKNGADLVFNSTVESELVFGRGWAYGTELYVKKNEGRLTGWIGYTLSRTMRQFAEINNGKPFPARYDRTHDVSVVAMYNLSPKVQISATWVYYTGNAVTFPSGKYMVDGQLVNYYTERNGYRMPDYHRLDLGLTWVRKKTARWESSWNFSVYNAYARENAYYIDFREKDNNPGQTEAVQVSLFKAIPSISYKFRF